MMFLDNFSPTPEKSCLSIFAVFSHDHTGLGHYPKY